MNESEAQAEMNAEAKALRLNDPKCGDMWIFTSNYGEIVRHVKSVVRNGTVSYTNNGRFYQCSMATWRRWARGAELEFREKW